MITATRSAQHIPLCERLRIRYPIGQAGMAFVARAPLAAAVSAAGGLGVIAAAHGTPADLREEIRRVRGLADKPFGVDILFAQFERVGKPAAIRAREEGDVENGSAAAGQSAGLIRDVRPAGEVIASIVDEAEAILAALGRSGA